MLEPAASNTADFTAFDHPGLHGRIFPLLTVTLTLVLTLTLSLTLSLTLTLTLTLTVGVLRGRGRCGAP